MATSIFVRRPVAATLILFGLVGFAGCDNQSSPDATTSLSVMLKDVPGDVLQAFVTISEIDLIGPGAHVLMSTPVTVNLLTLAANTATLVQGVDVPSGTYNELRFKITGACLTVNNGDGTSAIYGTDGYDTTPCGGPATGELQAPSFAQSGLKVTMAANALTITGSEKILLVDFDVSQSFGKEAGGSGKWVMHPVLTGGELEAGN
jgi:hypothetical protein